MRSALVLGFALALPLLPPALAAETAASLAGRIVIDGRGDEYTSDEWIIDTESDPAESAADSRWGEDNEIRRVAVTWDRDFLYIAVDASAFESTVLAFLRYGGGGVSDLTNAGAFTRAIELPEVAPNLIAIGTSAGTPQVARADAVVSFSLLGDGDVQARYVDVLELRIPWRIARPGTLDLLTAISGEVGSGAGDAAPDPSATLEAARFARAVLDRWLRVTTDADGDGEPDLGVRPRDIASVVPPGIATVRSGPSLDLQLSVRAFAPDRSETVSFRIRRALQDPPSPQMFVTCRVYAMSGELITVLYEDDPRSFDTPDPAADPRDQWDGTNRGGTIVDGGVYVINLSWGETRGERSGNRNASVAVVR